MTTAAAADTQPKRQWSKTKNKINTRSEFIRPSRPNRVQSHTEGITRIHYTLYIEREK